MGRCLGLDGGCQLCTDEVPMYSDERQTEIAVRSWGFFHLPSHQYEIDGALARTEPLDYIEMGESPARGEVPAECHFMAWHGEELTKFYVVSFCHVSVQTMALERALGFRETFCSQS